MKDQGSAQYKQEERNWKSMKEIEDGGKYSKKTFFIKKECLTVVFSGEDQLELDNRKEISKGILQSHLIYINGLENIIGANEPAKTIFDNDNSGVNNVEATKVEIENLYLIKDAFITINLTKQPNRSFTIDIDGDGKMKMGIIDENNKPVGINALKSIVEQCLNNFDLDIATNEEEKKAKIAIFNNITSKIMSPLKREQPEQAEKEAFLFISHFLFTNDNLKVINANAENIIPESPESDVNVQFYENLMDIAKEYQSHRCDKFSMGR